MARSDSVVDDFVEVDTECQSCGSVSTARVDVGGDHRSAPGHALSVARDETIREAELTMSLVRCAHCHRRSYRKLAGFIGRHAAGTFAAFIGLLATIITHSPWYVIALLALGTASIPFNAYRRLHNASSLVLSVHTRARLPEARVLAAPEPAVPMPTRAPDPAPPPAATPRILRTDTSESTDAEAEPEA